MSRGSYPTYCSCSAAGTQVRMQLDLSRPGKYICMGCGATEEVVFMTQREMSEQYTKTGVGFGHVPENLLNQARLIDNEPGVGPRISPFKEPWIETKENSGRSIKELEQLSKEINDG